MRAILPLVVALIVPITTPAVAQMATDTTRPTEREIGPLALAPTLGLTVGTDSNVFNESEHPREDLTGTFRPQLDARLRLGRGRLRGHAAFDFVYFREFARERSINTDAALSIELPLTRIRPYVGASLINTRQRSSFEIDLRARRLEDALHAGLDVRLTPRTSVAVAAQRARVDFRGASTPQEVRLRESLNRDITQVGASLRYALTPLTTAVLTTSLQRDRFAFVPDRNASSVRVTPGVEFAAFALITGKATFGMCTFETGTFETGTARAPRYTGAVWSIDLGTTIRDATRLAVRADRDVVFSFDVRTPYYLLTGLSGSITRRLTPSWDAFIWINRQFYAYRTVSDAPPDLAGRRLTALQYGGGLGYRVGRTLRFGVNADYVRRDSELHTLRDTTGIRVTNSITYGS